VGWEISVTYVGLLNFAFSCGLECYMFFLHFVPVGILCVGCSVYFWTPTNETNANSNTGFFLSALKMGRR
jgi:hypothetical protein